MADSSSVSSPGGSSSGQTSGLASLFGSANPVGSAVQAASAIAQTIAGISDMNKRRKFEQSLALLSNSQTVELNDKLLKANSDNERLQILSNSLVQYAISNETNQKSSEAKLYLIAGIIGVALLGVVVVFSLKK